jgi:choice-of-anchor A domain-containing protein
MGRHLTASSLALAVALFAAAAARADTADKYNLFVLGDMRGLNSATQGRVAVGGDASATNYSIGAAAAPGQPNFVVGGSLTSQSLNLNGGQTVVGGAVSNLWGSPNIQPAGVALPIDFGAEVVRLKDLSADLAGYAPTGLTDYALPAWAQAGQHHGQITLTGAQAGLNVFILDAAKLADASSFTVDLDPGATALINVTGANGLYYQTTFSILGGDASSLLWNFSEATSLSIYNTGAGFQGSILAPLATYNPGGWGAINGQVVVGDFYSDHGSTTIKDVAFAGGLLAPIASSAGHVSAAVPEPAAWAMMILGFGAIGAVLRRRAASKLAA